MAENPRNINSSSTMDMDDFSSMTSQEHNSGGLPDQSVQLPLDQPEPSTNDLVKRKRGTVKRVWNAYFQLFQQDQDYILEMNEIETETKLVYNIFVHHHEQKIIVEVKKCSPQQPEHNALRLVEGTNTPVHPRFNLTLGERLNGRWTVKEIQRNGSNAFDKYYKHEKVSTIFRSLNEVATFILYSCLKGDLLLEKEAYFNFHKVYGNENRQQNCSILRDKSAIFTGESENTTKGILLGNNKKDNATEDEELVIYSYSLNNPITNL